MFAIAIFGIVAMYLVYNLTGGLRHSAKIEENLEGMDVATKVMVFLLDKIPFKEIADNANTAAAVGAVTKSITYRIAPLDTSAPGHHKGMYPGEASQAAARVGGSTTVSAFKYYSYQTLNSLDTILNSHGFDMHVNADASGFYVQDEKKVKYYIDVKVKRIDVNFHFLMPYQDLTNDDSELSPDVTDTNYLKETGWIENRFLKIWVRVTWKSRVSSLKRQVDLISFKAKID